MPIKTQYFQLSGGLDLRTPAISVPPGRAIGVENYESSARGYRRIDGFERLDGRPAPSDASYWILDFDAGTDAMSAGDILTGDPSGATGELLIDAVIESGSYGGNDAAGYNVLVNVTGTFVNNEALDVSAAQKATADGVVSQRGADTDTLDATYIQDAIETTRADILAVPGSGDMRGVCLFAGAKYAFRDNAGATAVDMYKSTTAGWVLQVLGETMNFTSGGTTEIAEGDTITGDSSAKTAVVKRVILTSGTWAGGDAAGRFVLYSVSGAFTPGEGLEVSAVNLATCTADAVVNTLAAGGRFEFAIGNLGGHAGNRNLYGVDGVSLGWEWDGTVFTPIITGMTIDTPRHVIIHHNHLCYSFSGGSFQHSGIGTPYVWTILSGATEIQIGQEITGMIQNVTGTLTIFGRNIVNILYGFSAVTWTMDTLTDEAGGVEWTQQLIGTPIYLDDHGLRSLSTTQAFGDFKLGELTSLVEPLFASKRKAGITAVASIRVRSKDQYRIFWSDGTYLTMYFGEKQGRSTGKPEITIGSLGKVVTCAFSGEDSAGNEVLLIGSTDGFVYQLDSDTSFDGTEIVAFLRLPFNHVGSPTNDKRWTKATAEIDAQGIISLGVLADFSYGDPDQPGLGEVDFSISGGGAFWNEANWNEFLWSAQVEGIAEVYIDGIGNNMSLVFRSEATYESPHTIHSLTLHYSERRLRR